MACLAGLAVQRHRTKRNLHSYPDSVQYLYSLGNEVKSIKFGLDAITALLDALGRPQRNFRAVHVAGTNGKGSTCAMIASGLRAADFCTGLYTSPHLVEPTERIQINGAPVTGGQFASAFATVHTVAERLLSAGTIENHPTYFETVTAMAFVLFAETKVELAVLEVGMGGRLDATNVVTPELAVVTPIDYDHEQWLGNTIEEIAGEKAGILKPGIPAVFARQRPQAEAVLEARAAELGCPQTRTTDIEIADIHLQPYRSDFRALGLTIHCPLAGAHQVDNALTAVAALRLLEVSGEAVERGIADTRWPGRLELLGRTPDILVDGAHNSAGARALADYLSRFHFARRIWLIFGAMRDKSVREMMEILFPLAKGVVLVAPSSSRALEPQSLAVMANHPRLTTAATAAEALAKALQAADPADLIVVTGSLHLVGEFRALLVQ